MLQSKPIAYNHKLYPIPFIEKINFTDKEKELLYSCVQVKIFKKNERILSENEVEKYFSFVVKGLVVKYINHNGKKINIKFVTNGDVLCAAHSYFSSLPCNFFIDALEESTLVYFSKSVLDYLFSQGERFTQWGTVIMANLFLQFEEREKSLLLMDALTRLRFFMETRPTLMKKLSQVQIASYLNMQPETFSKLKKQLGNPTK